MELILTRKKNENNIPLTFARTFSNKGIVKYLIEYGANKNNGNKYLIRFFTNDINLSNNY